jgi:unsaturated rhamnogalacturonyl hydrolase
MQGKADNWMTASPSIPWSQRMAVSALDRYSLSAGRWHYKDGLLFKGIYHVWQATRDACYWERLVEYVDRFVDASGEIKTYQLEEYNLDQINPGKLLFTIYQASGQERYCRAIDLLRQQLRQQPRTHEGGFWHKKIYPYQMWLDGIYMAAPFYAQYAQTFEEPAAFDDIAFQILTVEKHTRDPHSGLLYHAWDESRQQPWADPSSGCSPHFWSRAVGWYVMALVDVLDFFPPDHANHPEIVAILERTLNAVAAWQDEATGLWWQVLDQGERLGNYREASGTCMFVYAIVKGIRQGILGRSWLSMAEKGFAGLQQHLLSIDDQGRLDLQGICTSAGLGGNPYRDGSFSYYVSEPVAANDLHGIGAFILAAAEMERITPASAGSEAKA